MAEQEFGHSAKHISPSLMPDTGLSPQSAAPDPLGRGAAGLFIALQRWLLARDSGTARTADAAPSAAGVGRRAASLLGRQERRQGAAGSQARPARRWCFLMTATRWLPPSPPPTAPDTYRHRQQPGRVLRRQPGRRPRRQPLQRMVNSRGTPRTQPAGCLACCGIGTSARLQQILRPVSAASGRPPSCTRPGRPRPSCASRWSISRRQRAPKLCLTTATSLGIRLVS